MRVANLKTSRPFIRRWPSVPSWTTREPLPGKFSSPGARAVGAELEAEEAALVDVLEHDRACAVAEEDERRAVRPVEHLRQDVAADHERALREARRDRARAPARSRT